MGGDDHFEAEPAAGRGSPRRRTLAVLAAVAVALVLAALGGAFALRAMVDDGSDVDRNAVATTTENSEGCSPPAPPGGCSDSPAQDEPAGVLTRTPGTTVGSSAPTTTIATTTTLPLDEPVIVTLVGDLGANDDATATLNTIVGIGPDAHFLVGDLSYSQVSPESAWCDYVRGIVGPSLPFEVLVGNHEDDDRPDGFIRDFAACMPDRLGVVGDYGVQYYADIGGVVRVIALAPDLAVDGVSYGYEPGSPERAWLESTVADARARGLWVVVAHHKVCVSVGEKPCEIGEELADWEAATVDVVVMGHEHNYQRSHQLSCVAVDRVPEACLVDTDDDHVAGDGAVFVIVGIGGRDRVVHRSDPELAYFANVMGEDDPDWGHGVLRLDASDAALTGAFAASDSRFADSFTISR